MFRILAFLLLPVICLAQVNSKVEKPTGELLSNEISPNDMKRKASYNLDEIKVRWKKAALENCPGVPCVVTPPAPSFTCGTSTVSDVDNNSYNTVLIGTQCWMKSNLRVMNYNNNDPIPDSTNSTWGTAIIGARTGYVATGVTGVYVGTFGYLYNWYAVNDSRKLCPAGWHVPTDSDWNKLVKFIDSGADTSSNSSTQITTAGAVLKSNVTNTSAGVGLGWNPGSPGTNTSGFSALPGGFRNIVGGFFNIRDYAFFWSATEVGSNTAWHRDLNKFVGTVYRNDYNKTFGFSVRCLRD